MTFLLTYLLLFLALVPAEEVKRMPYQLLLDATLSKEINAISVIEASQLKGAVFIDCRTFEEYQISHLQDAIFMAENNPQLQAINKLEKDQEIIVYCSIGYRSEKIVKLLNEKGYHEVYNLFGGIFKWKNEGLPIFNVMENKTDSIHAYNKFWGIWLNEAAKVY